MSVVVNRKVRRVNRRARREAIDVERHKVPCCCEACLEARRWPTGHMAIVRIGRVPVGWMSFECWVERCAVYTAGHRPRSGSGTTSSETAAAIAALEVRGAKVIHRREKRSKLDERDTRRAKQLARDAGWERDPGGRWIRGVRMGVVFAAGEAVVIVGGHPHAGRAGTITGRSIQPGGVGERVWEVRLNEPVEVDGTLVEAVYAEPAKVERTQEKGLMAASEIVAVG